MKRLMTGDEEKQVYGVQRFMCDHLCVPFFNGSYTHVCMCTSVNIICQNDFNIGLNCNKKAFPTSYTNQISKVYFLIQKDSKLINLIA